MEIAVTGAAGFIGSNLVRRLAQFGHSVHAYVDALPDDPTRMASLDAARHVYIADLTRDHVDFTGVDQVYHLAADMGGVGYFHVHDFWPYLNNSRMTFTVLEAAIKADVQRMFLASSACVYPTEIQMREGNAPLLSEDLIESGKPDQMYGREKLMMLRLGQRAPIDCRVGIIHTVYGVGQEREGERMKFPTAIATKMLAARDTGRVEIWGNGRQLRSYLWIDDAIDKILAVMDDPENGGPVNIGRQGAATVQDIADLCADIVGIDPDYTYTDDMPSGVLSRDCSNEKFWNLYGHMEPTGYREGFGRLIEWLDNGGTGADN